MQTSYLALLHLLPGMTHKRLEILSDQYGHDWEAVWAHCDARFLSATGCKPEQVLKALEKKKHLSVEVMTQYLLEKGIFLCERGTSSYPEILLQTVPIPYVLYGRGNKELLSAPNAFAIVGARKMTTYGTQIIDMMIPDLLSVDLVIVSGLAFGVDSYVHKKVLEYGGKTIGVVGSGVDVVYPSSNKKLVDELLLHEGLLLSDFPLGKMPEPFHFPLRNRIIAALSSGVLVVEAGQKSGACITADVALELGKEVFSVPGNIFSPQSMGTNALLKKGEAHVVTQADDILEILGYNRPTKIREAVHEDSFLSLFSFLPEEQEGIFLKFTGTMADFQIQLTMKELSGHIKKVEGTKWVRV